MATWDITGFNTFWDYLQADTYITFAQIIFLIVFYVGVTNHLNKAKVNSQLTAENTGNYTKF